MTEPTANRSHAGSLGTDHHLPNPLTSLIGRDAEIEAVLAMLRRPEVRLLTLTGPGGVGKTRIAIEVARRAGHEYHHGAAFISLAATIEPRHLIESIGRSLDIRQAGSLTDVHGLARALDERNILLVLDNFEHIVEAGPALTTLLCACPCLTILVTSRIVLRVRGEFEFPLSPLPLPDDGSEITPEGLEQNAAAAVFVERVRAVNQTFEVTPGNVGTIIEICRRLDGLPLAIELAAARTRVLQPHGLLARLDRSLPFLTGGPRDAPARQQTLRDTVAWSYDLLASEERHLFRNLSVFRGGWTLEAAAAVTGTTETETLEHLTALIESHLVQVDGVGGESRYRMLETLREFGTEQLEDCHEIAAARRHHANWCADHSLEISFLVDERRLRYVDAELQNMHAALRWCVLNEELVLALALAGQMGTHWYLLGAIHTGAMGLLVSDLFERWPEADFYAQANEWANDVMQRYHSGEPPVEMDLEALWSVAWLASLRRDFNRAHDISSFLAFAWDDIGVAVAVASIHVYLAILENESGDYDAAAVSGKRALSIFDQLGDVIWVPHVLHLLGSIVYHQGHHERASVYLDRARQKFSERNLGWSEAGPLTYLARIARDGGQLDVALDFHAEALEIRDRYGDRLAASSNLRGIAQIATKAGHLVDAVLLYSASEKVKDEFRNPTAPIGRNQDRSTLTELCSTLGNEQFRSAWAQGRSLSFRDAISLARNFEVDKPRKSARLENAILSSREQEVIELMTQGLTTSEIANQLSISPRTVSTHQSNIYGKLGVSSQGAAIAYAYQHGLVAPEPS